LSPKFYQEILQPSLDIVQTRTLYQEERFQTKKSSLVSDPAKDVFYDRNTVTPFLNMKSSSHFSEEIQHEFAC